MVDWSAIATVFSVYASGVVIPGPNFVAITHTTDLERDAAQYLTYSVFRHLVGAGGPIQCRWFHIILFIIRCRMFWYWSFIYWCRRSCSGGRFQ